MKGSGLASCRGVNWRKIAITLIEAEAEARAFFTASSGERSDWLARGPED